MTIFKNEKFSQENIKFKNLLEKFSIIINLILKKVIRIFEAEGREESL